MMLCRDVWMFRLSDIWIRFINTGGRGVELEHSNQPQAWPLEILRILEKSYDSTLIRTVMLLKCAGFLIHLCSSLCFMRMHAAFKTRSWIWGGYLDHAAATFHICSLTLSLLSLIYKTNYLFVHLNAGLICPLVKSHRQLELSRDDKRGHFCCVVTHQERVVRGLERDTSFIAWKGLMQHSEEKQMNTLFTITLWVNNAHYAYILPGFKLLFLDFYV